MIQRNLVYFIFTIFIILSCNSNDKLYDEKAVASLDRVSETIGDLKACSYTLSSYVSKDSLTQNSNLSDVYMRGPDKMYIHTTGTRGETSYWYDGTQMAYFKYDENIYDTVSAPDNIIKAIDVLHNTYNLDIPAADFFYPTLTDDVISQFDQVIFFDNQLLNDINCEVVQATNENTLAEIWIDKMTQLPYKLILSYPNNPEKYYEATFSNWRINPELPDILFEFEPPVNASRVSF